MTNNPNAQPFQVPKDWSPEKYTSHLAMQSEYVNSFGSSLLNTLIKEESDSNVFFSPLSIHQALMMTADGAGQETEMIFRNVLRLHDISATESLATHQFYITSGNSRVNTQPLFTMANSIWINNKYTVYSDYVSEVEKAFDAEVKVSDFRSQKTVGEINKWVNDKTEGVIPSILDRLSPEDQIVLLNTLHFKQEWAERFSTRDTRKEDFFSDFNGKQKCKMMHQTSSMQLTRYTDARILSIPFANPHARMAIILPQERGESTLTKVAMKYLQNDNFRQAINNATKTEVALSFPQLHIEFAKHLKDTLSSMGLAIAFTPGANFEKIGRESLVVSDVIHKATIDINEDGVEAAAATAVVMKAMASAPVHLSFPEPFVVNHPFALALYDDRTNLIFFAGLIRQVSSGKADNGGMGFDFYEL